ncbi:hypothetical protein ONS95_001204 [Cadophora gregata]|uniref:uncharacterized protein n=1 Tax=Cadophora gregata TaxID=51156 RepID=UPI0026DBF65B|nr:uncharacterized protein ONS95_001204 [Cadophora gregata]KAK0101990.1 hypothetical protein ONS96_005958 [Cadophora gregata f. sp. sojae]KAK0129269.1 hypothetical protein ONS95_001204 [Cadophora gregata]
MTTSQSTSQVRVEPITDADDFSRCFAISAAAFGTQTADGIWTAFNPGWETPDGEILGASRLQSRWAARKSTESGNPNVVFLKATVQDPSSPGGEAIAGMAIWVQLSTVEGHGDIPKTELIEGLQLNTLYPDDESSQKFLCQVIQSLTKQRTEVVKEAATRDPPAIMALDLCAVDPAFQRRGVAGELVQWGLDEAKRRGGLEAVMEASKKGRSVYARYGFKQEGEEIAYILDDEFKDRSMPSNVFMRTGYSQKGTT